jgi:hypothetical protein
MARVIIPYAEAARADLGPQRRKPHRREGRHAPPVHEVSDDEFEVFCFLLLLKEYPRGNRPAILAEPGL